MSAVQVALTAINPTTNGAVQVRPKGAAAPGTASLYYSAAVAGSQTNTTIVALGPDGTFEIRTDTSINMAVEVEGYFTAGDTAAGGYVPLSPATRIVDTRSGLGLPQARLTSGSTTTIDVAALATDVPANASAVFVNFEIVNRSTQAGHIQPYATGKPRVAAGLTFPGSVTTSASATVALGSGTSAGKIDVYLAGGPVDLLVNVVGFYTPVAAIEGEYSYSTFTPGTGRLLSAVNVPGNTSIDVPVANKFGMPDRAWGLDAVALNLQVRHTGTVGGHIGMWPDDEQNPGTTVLNYQPGTVRSNFTTVAVGSLGSVTLFNGGTQPTTVYLDLQGWYATPAALLSAPSEIAENLDAMPDTLPITPGVESVDGVTAPLTSEGALELPSATGADVGLGVPIGINDEEVVAAELTSDGSPVYADLDAAFEYIVQSVDVTGDADLASSTRNLITIHSPAAPDYFTFPVDLPVGASLELDESGAVVAVDADGNALGVFDAPWAIDADGNELPTHYEIIGPDTFAQFVDHSGATAYPVIADPVWLVPVIVVGSRAAVQVVVRANSRTAAQNAARTTVAASGRRPTGVFGAVTKLGYKSFTARNLRHNLVVRSGRNPANCQAHHTMPQALRAQFSARNIAIDNPAYALWWTSTKGLKNNHGSAAHRYNEDWRTYFRNNPNATQSQVLAQRTRMVQAYSPYYRC